ncbi:hypothetical protein SAMN05660199_01155 [Klenkia soli]|uniref:Uncharacterized protein n=1 Tax=Klenkia soli TaxID=1052260 RepID=A0A1H0G710_9ACTN|nr:hypothetical protein [Klenkia soli]SDO02539.1 hypothetical protein SAMN05660199_01155 [Klenkia soli]
MTEYDRFEAAVRELLDLPAADQEAHLRNSFGGFSCARSGLSLAWQYRSADPVPTDGSSASGATADARKREAMTSGPYGQANETASIPEA